MSPSDASQASSPVAVGDVVDGKYRVDRVLGQGAMGVVVAATHLQLEQQVAIKLLVLEGEGVPFERFLREARATARLKGEHVCRVIDVTARDGETPHIVMEYLAGQDLEQRLEAGGPMAVTEVVDYVLQACEGLAEAHAAGIVHRDLKPANLFLATAPDGRPSIKVVDFGLVKELDTVGGLTAQPALTEVDGILGSPLYMSPEQIATPREVDTRTDIWALGTVLYELLTGRLAFPAATLAELVLMIGHHPAMPPSQIRPELGGTVEAIILRCLEKSREARFPTVAHLAAELAPLASEAARPCAGRAARLLGIAEPLDPSMTGSAGVSPAVAAGAGDVAVAPGAGDVGSTIPLHDDDPVPIPPLEAKPAFSKGSTLPMDDPPVGVPGCAPGPVDPASLPNHGAPASDPLAETIDASRPSPHRRLATLGLLAVAGVLVASVVAALVLMRSDSEAEGDPPEAPLPVPSVQPSDHPEPRDPDHDGVVEPKRVPIFYAPNRGEEQPDCGTSEPLLLIDGCDRRKDLDWLREQLERLRAADVPVLAALPAGLTLHPTVSPQGHAVIEVRAPRYPHPTHVVMFPPRLLEIVHTKDGEPLVLHLDVDDHWWTEREGSDGRRRFVRLTRSE